MDFSRRTFLKLLASTGVHAKFPILAGSELSDKFSTAKSLSYPLPNITPNSALHFAIEIADTFLLEKNSERNNFMTSMLFDHYVDERQLLTSEYQKEFDKDRSKHKQAELKKKCDNLINITLSEIPELTDEINKIPELFRASKKISESTKKEREYTGRVVSERLDIFTSHEHGIMGHFRERFSNILHIMSLSEEHRFALSNHPRFAERMEYENTEKIGKNYQAALTDKAWQGHIKNCLTDMLMSFEHLAKARAPIAGVKLNGARYFMHTVLSTWSMPEMKKHFSEVDHDNPGKGQTEKYLPEVLKAFLDDAFYKKYKFSLNLSEPYNQGTKDEVGKQDYTEDFGNVDVVRAIRSHAQNKAFKDCINTLIEDACTPLQTSLMPHQNIADTTNSFSRIIEFSLNAQDVILKFIEQLPTQCKEGMNIDVITSSNQSSSQLSLMYQGENAQDIIRDIEGHLRDMVLQQATENVSVSSEETISNKYHGYEPRVN